MSGLFVVKLDENGDYVWGNTYPYPDNGGLEDTTMAVGPDGSVVIAGELTGAIDFGGGVVSSEGWPDFFLLKLDPDGAHHFSRRLPISSGLGLICGLAVTNDGDITLAGSYDGELNLGGGPLVTAGSSDIFVGRFDSSGNHIESSRYGDENGQGAHAMTLDAKENVILAGGFFGAVDFGNGALDAGEGSSLFVTRLP